MKRDAIIWGFIFGLVSSIFAIGLFRYLMLDEVSATAFLLFPGGFLSGTMLRGRWKQAKHDIHRTVLVIGWVITYPIGVAISSIVGKMMPFGIGEMLFFAIAMFIGLWVTDQVGKRTNPPQRD